MDNPITIFERYAQGPNSVIARLSTVMLDVAATVAGVLPGVNRPASETFP
jgi:hypothetical protein